MKSSIELKSALYKPIQSHDDNDDIVWLLFGLTVYHAVESVKTFQLTIDENVTTTFSKLCSANVDWVIVLMLNSEVTGLWSDCLYCG